MKNLFQVFSIRDLAGLPLDELPDGIMISAEADSANYFNQIDVKKFSGSY